MNPTPSLLPEDLIAVLKRMRLPYLRAAAPEVLATAKARSGGTRPKSSRSCSTPWRHRNGCTAPRTWQSARRPEPAKPPFVEALAHAVIDAGCGCRGSPSNR